MTAFHSLKNIAFQLENAFDNNVLAQLQRCRSRKLKLMLNMLFVASFFSFLKSKALSNKIGHRIEESALDALLLLFPFSATMLYSMQNIFFSQLPTSQDLRLIYKLNIFVVMGNRTMIFLIDQDLTEFSSEFYELFFMIFLLLSYEIEIFGPNNS